MAKLNSIGSRYWDFRAFFYALYYRLPVINFITQTELKKLRELCSQIKIESQAYHLDIGCGVKPFIPEIDRCESMVMDRSLFMLRLIRNLEEMPRIVGEVMKLPFKNGNFDILTAVGLSEYVRFTKNFLTEVNRLLKPKGYFLFTFSHINVLNTLRRIYNPQIYLRSMQFWSMRLEESGFTIVKSQKSILQTQVLCRKL